MLTKSIFPQLHAFRMVESCGQSAERLRLRFMIDPNPSIPEARIDADEAENVAWMQRAARGDESAFRLLVEKHQHAVVGTITRMLNDASEAEDIAQMAFVRLWHAAPKWQPDAKFTTYLFTIVRHLVFNESRRRSRKREVSLDQREESNPAVTQAAEAFTPDEAMEKQELYREIDAAIAALPEQQRLAVVLRTFEGYDYEEIARVLETSVSSVKSLLFRARTTLREALVNKMIEP
jgi:RNA polymerase sigma-70 factor (ECF subfamily)